MKVKIFLIIAAASLILWAPHSMRRFTHRMNLLKPVDFISKALEENAMESVFADTESEVVYKKLCSHVILKECFVSSGYGFRIHPILKSLLFHDGVDLAAYEGAPVYLPADGIVVSAGWSGGYGCEVIVDHGYGWRSRYAHMARAAVEKGRYVRKGEVLGYVGSTGLSTGPHLHFEIRYRRKSVDPLVYYPMLADFSSMFAWKKDFSNSSS